MSKETEAMKEMEKRKSEVAKEWQKLMDEDIEVFAPTLSLRQLFEDEGKETVELVIREWARPVAFTDDNTGEAKAEMVMLVDYQGETRSLWLSAESLKRAIMAIYQQHGEGAIGKTVIVTRRPYVNKEWGKTFAYNCQMLISDETQTDVTEY